jgi:aryl-alcohol dehydrogenase-like predicted oxidoreductase
MKCNISFFPTLPVTMHHFGRAAGRRVGSPRPPGRKGRTGGRPPVWREERERRRNGITVGSLAFLRTDYIDVLTVYYVERADEWAEIKSPGGAIPYLRDAKRDGVVRRLGVTSHQRTLAARMAGPAPKLA